MGTHISVTLTIMMKFTPETSQSDSNSSNAILSVSLAFMPIVQNLLKRSVTNCIKLSHLQKSSPIRGSLGFKRFHSSAPTYKRPLTNVQLKSVDANAQLKSVDANVQLKSVVAIDNKKMYTRLVSLLREQQLCYERVINRVSDADWEARKTVMATRRKEFCNLTAALSRAGNVDITECQSKSYYYLTPNIRNRCEEVFYDLVAEINDLVAEINDNKCSIGVYLFESAFTNMDVNADEIDNFKKLDRADAIHELSMRLLTLMRSDESFADRVKDRVSDADWEARKTVMAARTKEFCNLTAALSLGLNLDNRGNAYLNERDQHLQLLNRLEKKMEFIEKTVEKTGIAGRGDGVH